MVQPGAAARAADTPALLVANATASDGLAILTIAAVFARTIDIVNTTENAVPLTVEISELAGPDSRPVKLTWQLDGTPGPSAATSVPALGAAHLTMNAELAASGTYTAAISLIYGKQRKSVPLKITRTSVAPGVTVIGTNPVAFSGFVGTRSVHFSLKETAGVKSQPGNSICLNSRCSSRPALMLAIMS